MTTTRSAGQPNRWANCASAYCGDDCRTYTIARRSRCRLRIFDIDRSPKVAACGAGADGEEDVDVDDWRSAGISGVFIMHPLFVARCVELANDDAAECRQRSPPLVARQPVPELVDRRRFEARGGVATSMSSHMVHLLDDLPGVFESIPPGA